MRALGFLVADKNMEACLHGLLGRDGWHQSLGCAPVDVGERDVFVAAGHSDPGLYAHGAELLRPFQGSYEHMVVMIDAEWSGSPGVDDIQRNISSHLSRAGWSGGRGLALVLNPEVDVWLWTRTEHTARCLGWRSWSSLCAALEDAGWWTAEQSKPPRPKEAAEWALRKVREPRSSRIYRRLAETVGLSRCNDPAFVALRDAFRRWFPPDPK
ncbi:MAG: hypothetical protein RBU37_21355 [Myxococcota bacterium]|jgi:hypothetical protein|nr:hypothetical protein [Myxococcota bacterium]